VSEATHELAAEQILVVDDDLAVRDLVNAVLSLQQYRVVATATGEGAVAALQQGEFGAIILDLSLPDMSGEDILRAVRQSGGDTEVIILTGHGSMDSAIEAIQRGVFDYIQKPFDIRTVTTSVQNALTKRRLSRENVRLIEALRAHERELQRKVEQATEELRETNERLVAEASRTLAILQSLADGVVTVDTEGHVTFANGAASVITGWRPAELVGRHYSELLHDIALPEGVGGAECAASGPGPDGPTGHAAPPNGQEELPSHFRGADAQLVTSTGEMLAVALSRRPFQRAEGGDLGAVFAFRDLSREQELERLMREFLTTASHELRTPLTGVLGNVELMLDDPDLSLTDDQREMLEAINLSSRRLATLVDRILQVSRLESGVDDFADLEVSVPHVVQGVVEEFRAAAEAGDIQLVVELPTTPAQHRSPRHLYRVVRELLDNALKFTAPGGTVTITVEDDAEAVRIRVADTGCGIPAERLGSIFAAFVHQEGAVTRKLPGAGLGLTLARAIVRRLGGELLAESEVGVGSTFTAVLPALTGTPA